MSSGTYSALSPLQPDLLFDVSSPILAPEPTAVPVSEPESEPAPPESAPEPDMSSAMRVTPLRVLAPGETLPAPKKKRMDIDEMNKRPSWLPEKWRMDVKVRTSGSTAGLIDQYYYEPTTGARFRSKIEVTTFLETGIMPKRKKSNAKDGSNTYKRKAKSKTDAGVDTAGAAAECAATEGADVEPSGSKNQINASAKRKKSEMRESC